MKKIKRLAVSAATIAVVLGGASGVASADSVASAYSAPDVTPMFVSVSSGSAVPVLEKTDAAREAVAIASVARVAREFSDPADLDHTRDALEQHASSVAPAAAFYPGDRAASPHAATAPASAYYPEDPPAGLSFAASVAVPVALGESTAKAF
jgi:hypothetical protein